jgi:chaperonin GroES
MRKDILASGSRSAKFAVGGVAVPGEKDNIFRNVMSKKDAAKLDKEVLATVEHAPVIKQVFRPRGTTILVRRVKVEDLSTILDTEMLEKEKPAEGTVLAVGRGAGLEGSPVDVSVGDPVVFGQYAGTEFKLNGEVLLIMDIDDVKGTLETE